MADPTAWCVDCDGPADNCPMGSGFHHFDLIDRAPVAGVDIQQSEVHRKVVAGLRSAIAAHGPIGVADIGSAAKRIAGELIGKPRPGAPRYAEVDFIDGRHYTHWKELPAGSIVLTPDQAEAVGKIVAFWIDTSVRPAVEQIAAALKALER